MRIGMGTWLCGSPYIGRACQEEENFCFVLFFNFNVNTLKTWAQSKGQWGQGALVSGKRDKCWFCTGMGYGMCAATPGAQIPANGMEPLCLMWSHHEWVADNLNPKGRRGCAWDCDYSMQMDKSLPSSSALASLMLGEVVWTSLSDGRRQEGLGRHFFLL